MPTLLKRIQIAIGMGAVLGLAGAGCADPVKRTHALVDAAGDAAIGLEPYPLSALTCVGSNDVEPFCCYSTSCVAVDNAPCPPSTDPTLPFQPLPAQFWVPTCEVTGPFAPNPEDLNAAPGNCCYVVGYQVIEGRPLIVEHELVVAPITIRNDWTLG